MNSRPPLDMATTLTGERCKNADLIHSGFEAIIQHVVEMLCAAIDRGTESLEQFMPIYGPDHMRRNYNAAMMNKLPVTCHYLRRVARGDTRYTAVMFYERTRLGAARSGHFLEALPPGLSLFSGHTQVHLQDEDLRRLKLRDVVHDRIKTVTNLEMMQNNTERLVQLIKDHTLPDLPTGLPGRVHVFVARMRAICQGLRRVKPDSHFRRCRNRECCRLFYAGAANETASQGEGPVSPTSPVENNSYWDLAAGGPTVTDEQSEFCTWSCCEQWRWQLGHALPSAIMTADHGCRKTGRARVPEALRAVSKRNEQASRHMRTIKKEQREFKALGTTELRAQQQRRIRTLNVDLGLLYVASVVADSRTMSNNKVLPGAHDNWRSRPAFYAKALKEVGKIYDKYHVGGNVIANMIVHEPFLIKLKERAAKVF